MFVSGKDATLTDVGGGVKRKILAEDEAMMAVEVHFEEGAVGAVHTHPHVQISYVLEGRFRATVGDEERIIEKGDTYYTSPGTPHGAVCLERGILLDMFTPRRDDFLA